MILTENYIFDKISEMLETGNNYIFGAGKLGEKIYQVLHKNSIKVSAFIDNHPKTGNLCGIPIVSLDKVENKSVNIIISSINYMYDLEKQAQECGFKNTISFGILTEIFKELQSFNPAYNGLREDYIKNKKKYSCLREILDDEYSKTVLDTLILYRQTFDSSVYSGIYDRNSVQYFENFIPKSEIFVDGGAYDGENTIDFISRYPDYKKVYLFEPDTESIKLAKTKLDKFNNIEYFEYGISDKSKTLRFDSRHDFGSVISDTGETEIKCIALDNIIREEKAYIKMDIEGAELDGINGAQRLISNGSPLAICVYHKPQDIWKLPERIQELYPNYKFRLRHYSSCIFETVLYAIP